ncbi:mediator complex subunit Med5-domain-containing protein [Hygrophoropsis aurantiaca]|uniref:Mediator complex subunit Med5-domain-containing protein n=1 Tax=Hygrophoropsis aurantiaca TaxID=72124 RepID=A0ACB8AS58_9AGAM|nr:mediator complex subunit Med5-domain-containing protein [Hygrophoropsis aurantiaca]
MGVTNLHKSGPSTLPKLYSLDTKRMSLVNVTRNCFQNGISSKQWLELCQLSVAQSLNSRELQEAGDELSNSVIELYCTYPADGILQGYLRYAISEDALSIATFLATFLRAARALELHDATSLDTLCRIALDAHYSAGVPPVGSIVSLGESQAAILDIVQDALALLRVAHSLPASQFHHLSSSASELVIILLSCVTDLSQIPTAQAMVYLGDANSTLHTIRISQDLRQVLENFSLSLSLVVGDDAKATREAQMMHTTQMAIGKGDILGSNPESDTVTCGLLLQSLISRRATDFGSGNGQKVVTLLVGTLRWTSWSPNAFYTRLFIAALSCVAQSLPRGTQGDSFFMWKSFVIGRLPRILLLFEKAVQVHGHAETDWRSAVHFAVSTLLQQSTLLAQCDHVATQSESTQSIHENNRSFFKELLQQMLVIGLVDPAFAVTIDPTIANDNPARLQTEASEHGTTLEAYLDSRLTEANGDDIHGLLDRIRHDVGSHSTFAEVVLKRFTSHTKTMDVEVLSHITKILYSHDIALDIVSLHVKVSDLVFDALEFLSEYDCDTVGDPQTAVSHLGDIVFFVQLMLNRFQISALELKKGNKILSTHYLRSTSTIYRLDELTGQNLTAFNAWFKAIFDSNSEGIDDAILRSTKPKILLQISATLFSQAAIARAEGKIDNETLHSGISYFLGPLLNWTLVGVVQGLLVELQHRALNAPYLIEIVHTILASPACPRPVLLLTSQRILSLVSTKRAQVISPSLHYSLGALRRMALITMRFQHYEPPAPPEEPQPTAQTAWLDLPHRELREAFALARARKAPRIDLDRCLAIMSPIKFLYILWSELTAAASLGEVETCRRVATYVLSMPRAPGAPLLPVFMYNVLPVIMATMDQQQAAEKTMNVELVVAVVSSSLTAALHLEWAFQTMDDEYGRVLEQSSAIIARKLATNLRARTGSASNIGSSILRRLSSSPSFVANFPVFIIDI